MATAISYNKIDFTLPSGLHINVDVPAGLDTNLIEVGLRGFFGTLVGLTSATNKQVSRKQLIVFITNLVALSENVTKRTVFTNESSSAESKEIVERFLDSLGTDHNGRG
jgi:hypothetical protein